MEKINFTCRYFIGDRPCRPHKSSGVHCGKCPHFEPLVKRILIIKLDAIGDVLRTTSVLHGLKDKYSDSQITWITGTASVPLLRNALIDRVFALEEAELVLKTDTFDIVINLDTSPLSSRLSSIARADEKLGYSYNEKGYVCPVNAEAVEWFYMGIFDDVKKMNQKTYQRIASEICGLPPDSDKGPVMEVPEKEKAFARRFASENGIVEGPVIGFNTGAGGRWEHKKWTAQGYLALASMLKNAYPGCSIVLYGGPEEKERNRYLKQNIEGAVDSGSGNSLMEFAALMDLCDLLVTGDTLAMHIAIALKKKTVVLFGPTSSAEIELYGRGEKVSSQLSCLCCYRPSCESKPTCMEAIPPEQVFEAVKRQIAL